MKIIIRLPSSAGTWTAIFAVILTFASLLSWGIGIDMGTRSGYRTAVRELGPEIDVNAAEIATLNDRLIYLTEWAKFETLASWYGLEHNGRQTASGTVFDENELTAASPWIQFGKMVKVTNLENGLSVTVPITDRGPHPRLGRGIDLSTAAAREIGMIERGVVPVLLEPGV